MSNASTDYLQRRHLFLGWLGLLVYLSLGIALETLHGLKLDFYLDVRNDARRLTWSLAHAHGTLFALINVAFALTLRSIGGAPGGTLRFASVMLASAMIVMPVGFFLGGLWLLGDEPGIGILLVPVGALMMLFGVCGILLVLRASNRLLGTNATGSKVAAQGPTRKHPRRRKL